MYNTIHEHIRNIYIYNKLILFIITGIFSSLPQPGQIVLYDAKCHNSIITDLKLSRVPLCKFNQNQGEGDVTYEYSVVTAFSFKNNDIWWIWR